MEVIVMSIPRADLAKITAIPGFVVAHSDLGTREDEDPCHTRVTGRSFYDVVMRLGPIVIRERTCGAPH